MRHILDSVIEAGITPLVTALNELDFIKTIYSCEGHFDRPSNEKFLPTAYVTFSTSDSRAFKRLYRNLCDVQETLESLSLRMTYVCLLGLYTLSIWPDASLNDVCKKRAAVDAGVKRLSELVRDCREGVPSYSCGEEQTENHSRHPCGESFPPCMLVIPAKELRCPFPQPDG